MNQTATPLASRYRRPIKGWRVVSLVFPAVALILVLLYTFHWMPFGLVLVDFAYLYLLLAAFLPLCFIWIPIGRKAARKGVPWYDILFFLLSLGIPIYFCVHVLEILNEGWAYGAPLTFQVFSTILWLLTIEAGRRAGGPIFAGIITFFSFYPLLGQYMPGFLHAPFFPFPLVASYHAMSWDSLMGLPLRCFGNIFVGFLVFAVFLRTLGAGKFFNALAQSLLGERRAGNAKVAIFASGLFGSISGSSISNVFITGSFTIPAMKKDGLPAHFAAGVEAAASTGGVLMPPVMGVTAFIMAEFIEVPYAMICIAAAVPSILYYLCLFSQIDAYAARMGIKPQPITVEVPPIWRTLVNNLHIILGFLVLILVLFLLRLTAQAPWYAAAVTIVLAMFRRETRPQLWQFVVTLLSDLGRVLSELISLLAPIGMMIGSFIITGIAYSIPYEIVALAGGNVWMVLLLGAGSAFILGMGVSISAVYIFLAIVLCPGLVAAGFDLLAVHLFVLYCAVWSYITPPVCTAAYAAAAIAESDPMKTGFQAMKLGIAKYIVPFIFILSPALILRGSVTDMLLIIPTCLIGLVIISGALEGYFWRMGNLTVVSRVLLFGSGLLVAIPGLSTDFYGIGIFVVIFGLSYLLRGRSPLFKVLVRQAQSKNGQ